MNRRARKTSAEVALTIAIAAVVAFAALKLLAAQAAILGG